MQVDGKVDFVVLESTGQRWTLPPALRSVDRILRRMGPRRFVPITLVAQLSLDHLEVPDHVLLVRIRSGQLAEQLRLRNADSTGRSRLDRASDGQVEVGRRQYLTGRQRHQADQQ